MLALVLAAGCGAKGTGAATPTADRARAELVGLEARRDAGVDAVIALSRHRDATVRARAARSLARTGGARAAARLQELAVGADPRVRAAALWGLGVVAAPPSAAWLVARWKQAPAADRPPLVWALGRAGDATALPVLTAALADPAPAVRAEAGIALAMLGRREIDFDDAARAALATAAGDTDRDVRYGVANALWREHQPAAGAAADALAALAGDADPEVRAAALSAIAARPGTSRAPFVTGIGDDDWRARVVAARALAGDRFDAPARLALAAQLSMEWGWAMQGTDPGPAAHVLAVGLRGLSGHAGEETVRKLATALARVAAERLADESTAPGRRLVASMVHCLAGALLVRSGDPLDHVRGCGGKSREGWPRYARRALLVDVVAGGFGGSATDRLALWEELASDPDPRVRAAAIDSGVALAHAEEPFRQAVRVALARGVRDREIEPAGSAADAIAKALKDDVLRGEPGYAQLAGDLVKRAATSAGDVELELTFLTDLGGADLSAGLPLCQAALDRPNRTVRDTARACVKALTGNEPEEEAPAAAPPPPPEIDPLPLLGHTVHWELLTTRGRIVIELDPDRAPWNVATLVALTRRHFYDGTLWHRVVPGFVVQGGSPRNSGWGGPDFVVPGEPSTARFDRGAVGIADAGMDTGGSQLFIMHARAPHLEGRYTQVGRVVSAMDVVDALQVGDRILRATADVK